MSARRWVVLSSSVAALVISALVVTVTSAAGTFRADAVSPASAALEPLVAPVLAAPATLMPSASPRATPTASPTVTATAATRAASTTVKKPVTASPRLPANIASRLRTLPASTTQVIIVHASSANTTSATFETYKRVTGGWSRQFAAMTATIGKDGFSDHHVEGVPSTPIGMFGFGSTMYGVNASPGVAYAYHRLLTNDWWNENPASSAYNTFEHSSTNPGGGSEALWKQTVAYQYFAFIKYNVPAVAGKGSGIFLHENHTSSTSGCVSLPKADLIKVLTWLRPSDNPRIVLSPDGDLDRF